MFCTSHIHQFFDIQFIPRRQLIGENRFVRISFSKKYNKKTKYFSYDFEDFRCCFIICASSVLSSIIDYDEIKFSKLIAEGSFGKVYKGLFFFFSFRFFNLFVFIQQIGEIQL